MSLKLAHADINTLVDILSTQAVAAPMNVGVSGYFRNLVKKTKLPEALKRQRIGGWTDDPDIDAWELVTWAISKETNPADRRYTTLGSLLEPVLVSSGWETTSKIVALIFRYHLIRDEKLLDRLAMRYQVPLLASKDTEVVDYGPDIDWQGPEEDIELQGLFRPDPTYLDVGFILRAMEQTKGVCRVEVKGKGPQGTGVLIDNNLILTNFHVLGETESEVKTSANDTLFHFGVFTQKSGDESKGQIVPVDTGQAVVAVSPVKEYDFALLRVSDDIYEAVDVTPVNFVLDKPAKGEGLNILQHPHGQTMMLALSSSGVASILNERGLVQYVSRTAPGSSGSPCFNDDWDMVALHHAVRSKMAGIRGEGTLMSAIYPLIKDHLNRAPA